MYNILLDKNKKTIEMETKEELKKRVIFLNKYCEVSSEQEKITVFKTDEQGNIEHDIVLSLPEEKEDIIYYLDDFDKGTKEDREEDYQKQPEQQETKLKEEVDNKELDENDKEVLKTLKNFKNQHSEDITAEVVPSAKEKQRQIRQLVEKDVREEEPKHQQEIKEEKSEKDVEVDEEQPQEKLEDKQLQSSQKQELVTINEKENIIYVPKNIETAKSIMFRTFKTALRETQGEIEKLEEIIKAYERQILEHKKAEKELKEKLDIL